LVESASRAGSSVHAALLAAIEDGSQPSATRKKLQTFATLLASLQAQAATGPAALARRVLDETGYIDELRREDTVEADTRIENIIEVLGSMTQYESDAEEPSLTEFLEQVTLETDADRTQASDSITLMTVHAAKGLEFPVVFVAGLEEETFPHRGFGADEDPEDLEEERRLCYVAFTRARERLFVSYARTRRVYNELKLRQPSRFLQEMPQEVLHWVGARRRPDSSMRSPTPPARSRSSLDRSTPSGPYVDRSEANDTLQIGIHPGMQVRHNKFGLGRVTAVMDGIPARVTVDFADGPRSIVSSFLTPA
jgi:DNA helicase-2/ATP-dependent DNA helicase PcrA